MNENFVAQAIPYLMLSLFILLFGLGRKTFAESKVNNIIGYRTKRSKQSQETWREAHLYFGKVCIVISLILLSASYWVLQLQYALFIIVFLLLIGVILTEIHLAKKFPSEDKNP